MSHDSLGHQANVPEPRRRCISGRWMEMYAAVVYTLSCSLLSARPSIMILNSYATEHAHVRVHEAIRSALTAANGRKSVIRRIRAGNMNKQTRLCCLVLMTSLYRSCGCRLMLICLATGVEFNVFLIFFERASLKMLSCSSLRRKNPPINASAASRTCAL